MTPIYLDYNATTPVDPRVVEAMLPYLQTHFGNPSSASHVWGWSAERAIQKSRLQVADLLGCDAAEVFFTSGSTESNNWALRGMIEEHFLNHPGEKFHVLTSNAEHNSVLKPLLQLQRLFPIEVEWIPVNKEGVVDVHEVRQKIKPTTRLISFIWVNNEIGSVNPIQELSRIAHENKIIFHTDATQALGKVPVDLKSTKIDLLSLSAHKMYGPKGAGALIVRRKNSGVQIQCLICGGGQERGQRSGTLNVAGIVGLGEACRLVKQEMPYELPRALELQNFFWKEILNHWPTARLNGPVPSHVLDTLLWRSPVNLSVTFPQNFPPGGLQDPHLGVSSTSACSSGTASVSHVLTAIGLTPSEAQRTLRLSFGRFTTQDELKEAIQRLRQVFDRTELNSNK